MTQGMTTWTFDASDGVYKNHDLSIGIMEHAALEFLFVPHTTKVDGFGKGNGESVTLPYWKPLDEPTTPVLGEMARIPVEKLEMGTRQITVEQWGRGVQYTHLMKQLGVLDPKTGAQKNLKEQMAACMDTGAANAFKEAKVRFTPTSLSGGTIDTDGAFSSYALYNLTKSHMGVVRDYMANDLHVPMIGGDHYVGIFATKALRGLKDDKSLEAWHQYLRNGDMIYKSEVGQVEGIRCSECHRENALSNSVGTGNVLGEGVVFGEDAVARVEAETPELRAEPNFQSNFGLIKACAWYGIIKFAIYWDTANDREARVVYIGSKA
jgi:N4-gp56 family major capsid protein